MPSSPKYTASQVAAAFIELVKEHGDFVSNLKLQKLLYYAQGWNLAYKGEPLFADRLEAWVHGPVCPVVYRQFRHFGWKPIELEVVPGATPPDLREHVEDIWSAYGALTGLDLEVLTHREPPWQNARGDSHSTGTSTNEISRQDLWDFFSKECVKDGNQAADTPYRENAHQASL